MNQNQYFIEPEITFDIKQRQPASYIRKTFYINKRISQARLSITALGVYLGYFNGERLDDRELLPGFTDYNFRLQVQEYDITQRIRKGKNVIAAVIGDGWYRGALGIGSNRNVYGTKIKFMCFVEIEYEDGRKSIIYSDEDTKASQNGSILQNDLKVIEKIDARKEICDWAMPDYDDSDWHGVIKTKYEGDLIPHEGVAIRKQEEFTPTILHTPDGNTVLDFGQNMAGRITFNVQGKSGHEVQMIMGETLDENKNFTQKNLVAEGASMVSGELGQKFVYILKDGVQSGGQIFQICGFRYVKLVDWPEEVKAENFKAHAIYADIKYTGRFECSNVLINQLVKNVRWGQKSNFMDTPTDNPTRERSGWSADISVFCQTACYLADTKMFLNKWLHDFISEQKENGNLPYVIPDEKKPERANGCCGWSDALSNVAMTLYEFYGDKKILEEVYEPVKRYVEFNVKRAKEKNKFFIFRTGKHRRYIIEKGFHYGEWLEPGRAMYKDYFKALLFPDTEVTTAWFFYTTNQLVQMAKILGRDEDKLKYEKLAAEINSAYHKEFLKNKRVKSKRHCRYVRPIGMGLVTEEEKKIIATDLNRKCIENDYKIGTGFLTTWLLLPVLTECGFIDTAYKILENVKQPGWLYSVTKGATTVWENWNGITEENVPVDSHNHYAPGAVVAWLFRDCAGIRPLEPGFKKIQIKPIPGGSLTYARAEYESCQGNIISEWKIDNGRFSLEVTIPEGIPAEIIMPNGEKHNVVGGCYHYQTKTI